MSLFLRDGISRIRGCKIRQQSGFTGNLTQILRVSVFPENLVSVAARPLEGFRNRIYPYRLR